MVKRILKNNGVTLSEFADVIGVTRPTLDSYIKSYDYNGYLTNPVFNNVFSFLFDDSNISNNEFIEKYAYIRRFFGKKAIESSDGFLHKVFSLKKKESPSSSSLRYEIINLIGNNDFSEDVLKKVLTELKGAALSYALVKEFEKYVFYHETVENEYYLVFKAGSNNKKENSIKIDNLYHYIVFKTKNYDDMCQFIKETIGADIV